MFNKVSLDNLVNDILKGNTTAQTKNTENFLKQYSDELKKHLNKISVSLDKAENEREQNSEKSLNAIEKTEEEIKKAIKENPSNKEAEKYYEMENKKEENRKKAKLKKDKHKLKKDKRKLKEANKLIKEKKIIKAIKILENILSHNDLDPEVERLAEYNKTRAIRLRKKENKKRKKVLKWVLPIFIFIILIIIIGFLSFLKYQKNNEVAEEAMSKVDSLYHNDVDLINGEIILLADTAIFYFKNANKTMYGKFNSFFRNENDVTRLDIAISLKEDEGRRVIQRMIYEQKIKNEIYQYLTNNLSEGLRLFKFVPNEKFGYLDKNDSVIILPKFDYIPTTDKTIHFKNGQAKARIGKDTFFIDNNGNRIK